MTIVCDQCGNTNKANSPRCQHCGAPLPQEEHTPIFLKSLDQEQINAFDNPPGLGLYGAPTSVTLLIKGHSPLHVKLAKENVLGRTANDASLPPPTVNLAPYGAASKGVSRHHAVIHRQGNILTLTDMESTNGTKLNGERLNPGKPRILKSNDDICLGRLAMRIRFQ